jgi:hypothetical protein
MGDNTNKLSFLRHHLITTSKKENPAALAHRGVFVPLQRL